MKFYDYVCEECGKITEYKSDSMLKDLPEYVQCQYCGENCTYSWKQSLLSGMIIPEHMKATSSDRFKYNKMTREQKKYTKGGIEK
jgi:DNA-directed RNA polymerase subunit RPC12/RpoP